MGCRHYFVVDLWQSRHLKSMSTSSSCVNKPVGCPLTSCLPFYKLDYGLVGLVVFCLSSNFWTQFFHPIISQGNLRRRSRWFIYFFRIWFLQFPSEQLSGYNSLGVYCKGWWRSIAFDRTLIFFWASLMSTQYTVFWYSSRSSQDLCVLCS